MPALDTCFWYQSVVLFPELHLKLPSDLLPQCSLWYPLLWPHVWIRQWHHQRLLYHYWSTLLLLQNPPRAATISLIHFWWDVCGSTFAGYWFCAGVVYGGSNIVSVTLSFTWETRFMLSLPLLTWHSEMGRVEDTGNGAVMWGIGMGSRLRL